MEKSIENIWKEGFLQNNALVAPKINDLYNQKSQHAIDRFKRLAKANLIGIVVASGVILVFAFMAGIPVIGSLMAVALTWTVVVGLKQSKILNQISVDETSYQYLQDFDHWLRETMSAYERLYKVVYPSLFGLAILGTFYGNYGSEMSLIEKINNDSEMPVIYGVPMVVIIPLVLIPLLSSIFSAKLYQLDIDLMYGRIFRKIEELLNDMKELTTMK